MGKAITISKQEPALVIKTMDDLEHILRDPNAKATYMQLSFLEDITDNFSDARCIGRGGSASVYKGKLRNGMEVAVKKLYKMVEEIHEDKFEQEVRNLMKVKHKNIVRFLGYCSDTQRRMVNYNGTDVMAEERQRLLCFEFLPNESLDKHITDVSYGLDWHMRYDIIKGICFGVHYLHMKCKIAHMDLKPHNIFMDDNMVAKIGDFGISRLINPNESMVTSNIIGTRAYMAPEYIDNGLLSKKADIFSFGIIILELLTGSRHYGLIEESSMERYTVEVVGKWMKRLPNAAYSQQVRTCVLIAMECVRFDKDKRPTTKSIINKLNNVEFEIREKLIKEGQEWVEGITNVTVGVVALVLILRSWVLTIGVAIIVLLRLQGPMSSWPRVVARECVSYNKDKRPTTECIINKRIKVEFRIREKLINEGQEWVERITNVTVGVVALVLILRSWVLTILIGVAVIVLLRQQNAKRSWPGIVARECVSSDKDKKPTTECIINKVIKVQPEIREKLINKGQESGSWVEGITNVTVGVLVLVLILRSWVLTIGVAVIVLCLQNPMSSWPRVIWVILFGIGAVLLTVLILMNPTSWPWVLLILKVPTALLLTILDKVAIFVETALAILVKVAIFVGRLLWHHEADLLTLLAKVITAAVVKVLSPKIAILLDHTRWSRMTLLFTIVSILAAVVVLLNTSTSWSWVEVARTIMKAITPMNLLAIAYVDQRVPDSDHWKSRPWIILFIAIEALQATVVNLVNPIISLQLVETAYSVLRFPVGLLGIQFTVLILFWILAIIEISRKRAILSIEGSLLLIILHGPKTLWPWQTDDVMATSTLFASGFVTVILLPILWRTINTSKWAPLLLLLYPVAVALAADIVIIRGTTGIFFLFAFLIFCIICGEVCG